LKGSLCILINSSDLADVKQRRLSEVISTFHTTLAARNARTLIGSMQTVLVEGMSRRSNDDYHGRAESGRRVLFAAQQVQSSGIESPTLKPGQYVNVRIESATVASMRGTFVGVTELAQ
jgi:tRNA-2-methylthio-N6-dimethylallyladenosine synthase